MRGLVLLVAMLVGAVAGSQVPAFVAAYQQRLGGALDEARRHDEGYARLAATVGLDVEGLIRHLHGSADPVVVRLGGVVAAARARRTTLEADAAAVDRATPLARPMVLLRHHDPAMLRATWRRFESGLALEPGFGAIGALVAGALALIVGRITRLMRRSRKPRGA